MKCTDLVTQDHVVLRRGLDILDGMVKKLEDGGRIEIADVSAILKFLKSFGDEYHRTMEEKVLFPALQRAVPQECALQPMLFELSEERTLITEIESALLSKRVTDLVRNSRRLSLVLRSHFEKVDAVLHELSEGALSKEEDNMVVAEFTKNRRQPEIYVNFSRLQWRYVPNPQGHPTSSGREIARAQSSAL